MVENNELNHVNQQIRVIRKYSETNPFDFTEFPKDEVIDLKQFLDIAENIVVFYEKEPIFNVIVDPGKNKYPFILK